MGKAAYSMIEEEDRCLHHMNYVLSKLGVDIPHSSSREQTLKLISQTQSTLDGISDSTLLSYHTLSDYKKVMAMKFLAKLEHSIQQTNTSLQPLVTIKIIQLTIEHGMSPMSAIGFAYFGGMLAELGDLRGGHRYSQLTKALLEKYQCNEIAGEVFFLSTELLSYIEPLQVTNEYRIQGQAAAMTAGDIHWACMNKLMFTCTLLWQGANLSGVREAFTNAGYFAKEHDHRTSLYYMFTFQRSISTLIESLIENQNPYQLVIFYFHKMFISLVFNNYDEMKHNAEKFLEFRMPSWFLLSGHAVHAFIGGLVSFRIFRETRDPLWAQRGVQFKERIRTWKDQGSLWNFENKIFLLEAEEFFSNGNVEKAKVCYENAVLSARAHKFVHEEALANELAGIFYLDIGNRPMAFKNFTDAHGAYFKWGACAKVATLFAYMQDTFWGVVPSTSAIVEERSDVSQSSSLMTDTLKRRPSL
ncbi:hypothetical protein HJC23_008640 [Cyclotella cryptica]|uniref:Uncharacterized protein n=1 Tax=Cyclotella cryptica TaxID=29204 RepID=A0ABD3NUV8_9STRA